MVSLHTKMNGSRGTNGNNRKEKSDENKPSVRAMLSITETRMNEMNFAHGIE